ncbi:hypothetical protein [Methylobacterium radiotolerans]|uniref:hypothetical protein n=1 Tax=Methylobacterium radiotolerans TaxID=31998 RepID=UPI001F334F3F|nr:hypothetical protein [Methylobacterium radiotolerans]UIY45757.1 hypothetical protein LZ599_32185 [Methylobacterium radiotolerans]
MLLLAGPILFVVANFQVYNWAQWEIRRAVAKPASIDWRSLPMSMERLKPRDMWLNDSGLVSLGRESHDFVVLKKRY